MSPRFLSNVPAVIFTGLIIYFAGLLAAERRRRKPPRQMEGDIPEDGAPLSDWEQERLDWIEDEWMWTVPEPSRQRSRRRQP